jgi:ABC-2 type transport system ATP-binding protein
MADRIGIISKGKLIVTEEKSVLMKKLGKKELVIHLDTPLPEVPQVLSQFNLQLSDDKLQLILAYDPSKENKGITNLIETLKANNIKMKDLETRQSSLEEIFVQLVGEA